MKEADPYHETLEESAVAEMKDAIECIQVALHKMQPEEPDWPGVREFLVDALQRTQYALEWIDEIKQRGPTAVSLHCLDEKDEKDEKENRCPTRNAQ